MKLLLFFVALIILNSPSALADSSRSDSGWPGYGNSYDNTRHVDFDQINTRTVRALVPVWKFRTGVYGPFEATPIVVGRTMYITTGVDDAVIALDATTGALKWRFAPTLDAANPCCGLVNRGVAVDSARVFLATIDDRLIALDAETGTKRWETRIADPAQGYTETMAPLAWQGLVFIGSSGGERAMPRGMFSAYSQRDGHLVWRWWSVSAGWEGHYVNEASGKPLGRDIAREKRDARFRADAWLHGGGAIWMTPALDPARSTLYVGVGNPNFELHKQPGDNLFTCSVVALDARTGKMRWYYQEVPHDLWDYDAASPTVLFQTRDLSGKLVDAVGEAGKTGWFYVLNRTSGKLIRITDPFVPQHDVFKRPTPSGVIIKPSGYGGAVAPVAYNPRTHLVFVQAKQGRFFNRASTAVWTPVGPTQETLTALNVDTGKIVWHKVIEGVSTPNRVEGGLSAADLVFIGQESGGALYALDARNGVPLWSYQTAPGSGAEIDAPRRTFLEYLRDLLASIKHALLREPPPVASVSHIHVSPIAYVVDGREYIAVAADADYRLGKSAGDTVYAFALSP